MPALAFNAFVMNTASHIQHGQWRHPDARQVDFNDVDLWVDLARTLERGLFDAIFFADVVGLYGPLGGDYEVNAREGLQIPSNDPSVLLSALAVNTEHLGLAFARDVNHSPASRSCSASGVPPGSRVRTTSWPASRQARSRAASSMRAMSAPCNRPPTASPTSRHTRALTRPLSPVNTLTVTPLARRAARAGAALSLGGSRKAT